MTGCVNQAGAKPLKRHKAHWPVTSIPNTTPPKKRQMSTREMKQKNRMDLISMSQNRMPMLPMTTENVMNQKVKKKNMKGLPKTAPTHPPTTKTSTNEMMAARQRGDSGEAVGPDAEVAIRFRSLGS